MRFLRFFTILFGLASPALAASTYILGPQISTTTGQITWSIAGTFNVAAGSSTISTPTIKLDGGNNVITVTGADNTNFRLGRRKTGNTVLFNEFTDSAGNAYYAGYGADGNQRWQLTGSSADYTTGVGATIGPGENFVYGHFGVGTDISPYAVTVSWASIGNQTPGTGTNGTFWTNDENAYYLWTNGGMVQGNATQASSTTFSGGSTILEYNMVYNHTKGQWRNRNSGRTSALELVEGKTIFYVGFSSGTGGVSQLYETGRFDIDGTFKIGPAVGVSSFSVTPDGNANIAGNLTLSTGNVRVNFGGGSMASGCTATICYWGAVSVGTDFGIQTNSTNRITVKNDGTLIVGVSSFVVVSTTGFAGFGTATPGSLVDVNGGSITVRGTNAAIGIAMTNALPSGGSMGIANGAYYVWDFGSNAASRRWGARSDGITNGDYQIVTESSKGSGLDTTRFYIDPNGNASIGTTAPQTKFDVNGSSQFGSGATKSTFTATGFWIPRSFTLAQIQAYTPAASEVGSPVYCSNCTSETVCVSTGTTIQGFSGSSGRTNTCK